MPTTAIKRPQSYRESEHFDRVRRAMNASALYTLSVVKPKDVKVGFGDFHYEVQDATQNKYQQFTDIIIPRRHAKTTIVSRGLPIWHTFEEEAFYNADGDRSIIDPLSNDRRKWPPPVHIVLSSRTEDGSKDDLDWIKDVLDSPECVIHYGKWGEETALEWTKHRIVLKNGTCMRIKGMGQQFVGLNYRGLRPTLEVLNDMEDETNTATDDQLAKNAKWLAKSVEPSLDNNGRLLLVGTPKHRNCLVEVASRKGTGYLPIRYSAILDENTSDERALWEEWLPLTRLKEDRERARAKGQISAWYMEWMCTIRTDESDFGNIQFWAGDEKRDRYGNLYLVVTHTGGSETNGNIEAMQVHEPPMVVPVNCFLGADPAIGKSNRSDPSVIFIRGYDAQKRSWSVRLWYKRGASVTEQARAIVDLGLEYRVKNGAVETTAYQDALRQRVMELLAEKGEFIPGINRKNNPRKKKVGENSRLAELQPDFSLGRVFCRVQHTQYRDEALDYPDGEEHCLDADYYSRVKSWAPMHTVDMLDGRSIDRRERQREAMRERRKRREEAPSDGRAWLRWS